VSTKLTSQKLGELLPTVLASVEAKFQQKPQKVVEAWPEVIGQPFASMSFAELFDKGVLHVKVKNSSVLSLLSEDKNRIIESFRVKFSGISIRNIVFRIG